MSEQSAPNLAEHVAEQFTPEKVRHLRNRFHRDGFVKIPEIVTEEVRTAMRAEVNRLLDLHAERRDLVLGTTGNTPRFMSVVRSELIAKESEFVTRLYRSEPLLKTLGEIAGEPLYPCPAKDEEFLITRQERKGDTHGWHWGDFSFALIWIVETPDVEVGGMLQCVPHTIWDKSNPGVHRYLCDNLIATHGFVPGDIYFLRTDTTLHRTVPLREDATRVIVNLTWAARKDLEAGKEGDDRWWEDSEVSAAKATQD